MATHKAVAKKDEQKKAVTTPGPVGPQFEIPVEDIGAGTDFAKEDKAIPFIGLIQALSPQKNKQHEKHIPGAEEGDFFNTVTQELFKQDAGVIVVPVHFEKVYNIWVNRKVDPNGGFKGTYMLKETAEADCDMLNTKEPGKDGLQRYTVVDTANHYVLYKSEELGWQPAILSFTSTKLKASRQWNFMQSSVTIQGPKGRVPAPVFSRYYKVTSVQVTTNGNTYFVPKVEDMGWVDEVSYLLAKDTRVGVTSGAVTVDYTKADNAPEFIEAEVVDENETKF